VTNDKDSRDSLFDGIESTSNIVRRYAAIEKVYVGSSQGQAQDALQDSILSVYGRILEFEARALCQCHHNVAFQTFKNMFGGNTWKDVVKKISDADTTCTKLLPTLDAESQSSHSKQLSDILSAQTDQIEKSFQESNKLTESILEEVRAARNEQRYRQEQEDKRNFLSVLRTTDFDFSKNKNPERSPGTCEWLLQHPEYQKWLKQASTPCLWLTADPGCGKSVLSRYLVDDFTEIAAGNATICYFFFKAGEENENPNNALCALLYQLFEQNEHLLEKYGIPEYQKGGSLANLFEPLWSLLVRVCRDPDAGQIICILDALDECAASHKRILATKFAEFCAGNPTSVNFRILITSRIENALQAAFNLGSKSKATFVRLTGEGEKEVAAITKEINLVINEEIERFKEAREQSEIYDNAHNILRQEIDKVDNRTYLWVSLVFPELHENAYCEESELLQIFKTLPRTVEKAYEGILSRSTNVERARKLLSIVLAAIRPLTMMELKIAFSIDRNGNYSMLDKNSEVESSKPKVAVVGPIERAFRESIRQYCGLFIRITESKVYLIHQTAQEFLLESQIINNNNSLAGWQHSFKNSDTHLTLARSCIWYLKLPQFGESGFELRDSDSDSDVELDLESGEELDEQLDEVLGEGSDEEADEEPDAEGEKSFLPSQAEFISQHQFVEYAATHWTAHFKASNATAEDEISAYATDLCSMRARAKTWSRISRNVSETFPGLLLATFPGLLLAAYFDLVQVLKILLLRGEDISQVDDENGETSLHIAAGFNHLRAAKVLTEFNAPLNARTTVYGDTPLHYAMLSSCEIVELLLSRGADVHAYNNDDTTALHLAAERGQPDIVGALVNAGANVNTLDKEFRSPLHLATASYRDYSDRLPSYKSTIDILIENGADPTLVDRDGKTAMQLASDDEFEYLFGDLGLSR
jgi:ankyrin repeat protein